MKNFVARCTVAAALLGTASIASASISFLFDPTGGGAGATADLLDQAPGTALALGGITATAGCFGIGGIGCSNPFTLLYQANLAQTSLGGIPVFSQGGGGALFNFTAGFGEIVTTATGVGPGALATFAFDAANPVNFFRMYTGSGDNLTGAGFGTGTLILEGNITGSTGVSLNAQTLAPLDGANDDDWNGTTTTQATGSTQINIDITFADAGYFPDLLQLGELTVKFLNTSQVTPFNQADPSCAMIGTNGVAQGYAVGAFAAGSCTPLATTIGNVNGAAPGTNRDFIFQADANSSFDRRQVPEPGSLALLATSLLAAGLVGRRRRGK